jgi:antitoxin VapB
MKKRDRLNIKRPEARLLAGELAKMRGETITAVVTAALREELDRVRRIRGLSPSGDKPNP